MFNTYEELMATVEERRADTLTMEVDLGSGEYSPEYEEAKKSLASAEAMAKLGEAFLGRSGDLDELRAKVDSLRPARQVVWLRYTRIPLKEWALLIKQKSLPVIEQYEKVLASTFVGIYGSPDADTPLTSDPVLVGTSNKSILNGGTLLAVINTFMEWQNSGGSVTINPTKSASVSESY